MKNIDEIVKLVTYNYDFKKVYSEEFRKLKRDKAQAIKNEKKKWITHSFLDNVGIKTWIFYWKHGELSFFNFNNII